MSSYDRPTDNRGIPLPKLIPQEKTIIEKPQAKSPMPPGIPVQTRKGEMKYVATLDIPEKCGYGIQYYKAQQPRQYTGQDEAVKIQTEFKHRIQTARQEIQTKFIEFTDQLKQEETRLLEKLNEIENEVIKDFELSSKTLVEITQAREQVLATLKSNTTNTLLENTLEMYDKEIEAIKMKSKIYSTTIQLKWKTKNSQFANLCELTIALLGEFPVPSNPFQDNVKPTKITVDRPKLLTKMPGVSKHKIQIGNQLPEMRQLSGQQQQQQREQHWQCPHCTSYNSIKYTFCEVCYKSPDFKPDFQEVQSTPTQPTSQCPFCSSTNRMQDINCANCGKSMIQAN